MFGKAAYSNLVRRFSPSSAPGPYLAVQPDDTFLVSYPKSGNTWVRFLVANLVYPEQSLTLTDADRIIPFVDGPSRTYFKNMQRPRVIKSHYPFQARYKRVIYVVRDPRDVALSQYYYQIKRGVLNEQYPIEQFVAGFVEGVVCPYGSWGEHVAGWLRAGKKNPELLLIRYEDLLRDPLEGSGRIAGLLGIEANSERLTLAVERSSAKHMRTLEAKEGDRWGSTKGTRQDISFVRAAKERQWVSGLPPACIEKIETAWPEQIKELGYKTAAEALADAADGAVAQPNLIGSPSGA